MPQREILARIQARDATAGAEEIQPDLHREPGTSSTRLHAVGAASHTLACASISSAESTAPGT